MVYDAIFGERVGEGQEYRTSERLREYNRVSNNFSVTSSRLIGGDSSFRLDYGSRGSATSSDLEEEFYEMGSKTRMPYKEMGGSGPVLGGVPEPMLISGFSRRSSSE